MQRALGWTGSERKDPEIFAACPECKARLRFDVADPQLLGRSMQQCTNPSCPNARPHPMTRADFQELSE